MLWKDYQILNEKHPNPFIVQRKQTLFFISSREAYYCYWTQLLIRMEFPLGTRNIILVVCCHDSNSSSFHASLLFFVYDMNVENAYDNN